MSHKADALTAVVDAVAYEGVAVEHEGGWRTRGGSRFDPKGFTVHHDASPRGSDIRHIIRDGHSRLSGPLANLYLTRKGVLVVIAAGRANHAGKGGWRGLRGNNSVWGLEIANDGVGEPYSPEQLRVVRLLMRAFVEVDGVPVGLIHSHHEWRSEKPDPAVDPQSRSGPWHMDRFRAELSLQPDTDDDMETLMAKLGPPMELVKTDKGRWLLVTWWPDHAYSHVASEDGLDRLINRAERDDVPYITLRDGDFPEAWLVGMREDPARR